MKQGIASVISNSEVMPAVDEVMPSIHLMWLDSPEIAAEARPGQFVMVRCGGESLLRRPLSVHQVDGGKIALLFTVVGKGTRWLSQCRVGDDIDILEPRGNVFSIHPNSHNLLLVAGGMGIAPLFFLAEEASKEGYSITVLIGIRTAMVYLKRSSAIKGKFIITTEDGTDGQQGIVTDLLPDYADRADQIFACGPVPMYRNMADNYPQLKSKSIQVSLEARMGCGFGVCYGCTVRTKDGLKQVCKDGPVFELKDIIWDELAFID